jgi:hypothetical protein
VVDEPELSRGGSKAQRDADPNGGLARGGIGMRVEAETGHTQVGFGWSLNGFCEEPLVTCEARAHQGPHKWAQKLKVMNDA